MFLPSGVLKEITSCSLLVPLRLLYSLSGNTPANGQNPRCFRDLKFNHRTGSRSFVYGLSFTTLFFRNYYVSIPDEMIKAARIDGAGFFKIFFKVLLPISSPIIVVTVIWQFTNIWNDFLFGSSFSFGEAAPIQVALNNMVLTSTSVKEYNVDMAAAFIAGIPTLLVYILAGKYFIRGLTAGSVKG